MHAMWDSTAARSHACSTHGCSYGPLLCARYVVRWPAVPCMHACMRAPPAACVAWPQVGELSAPISTESGVHIILRTA